MLLEHVDWWIDGRVISSSRLENQFGYVLCVWRSKRMPLEHVNLWVITSLLAAGEGI